MNGKTLPCCFKFVTDLLHLNKTFHFYYESYYERMPHLNAAAVELVQT